MLLPLAKKPSRCLNKFCQQIVCTFQPVEPWLRTEALLFWLVCEPSGLQVRHPQLTSGPYFRDSSVRKP